MDSKSKLKLICSAEFRVIIGKSKFEFELSSLTLLIVGVNASFLNDAERLKEQQTNIDRVKNDFIFLM